MTNLFLIKVVLLQHSQQIFYFHKSPSILSFAASFGEYHKKDFIVADYSCFKFTSGPYPPSLIMYSRIQEQHENKSSLV